MRASILDRLEQAQKRLASRDPRPEALEEQLRRDLTQQGGPRTAFLVALVDARALWREFPELVEAPELPGPREIAEAILKVVRPKSVKRRRRKPMFPPKPMIPWW